MLEIELFVWQIIELSIFNNMNITILSLKYNFMNLSVQLYFLTKTMFIFLSIITFYNDLELEM